MHADKREDVKEVAAGDIAAIVGLKESFTGETLCDMKKLIVLETIEFPDPVIKVAVEPKSKGDQDKLTEALIKLAEEDPTFRVQYDDQTGQTVISGMGELHLDIIVDRLKREFRVQCNVGRPQVAYRETITRAVRIRRPLRPPDRWARPVRPRVAGDRTQRVWRWLRLRGQDRWRLACRASLSTATQKGIVEALESGVLAGYPVVDVRVELVDGSYHEVDSSEMAFKIAGSMAFKDGAQRAGPVLLEPVMQVETVVPDDFVGDAVGDFSSRRGQVEGMESRSGGVQAVRALVPLSEMFGYATDLRSMTSGRGSFSMQFEKYMPVSQQIAEKVLRGQA